MENSSRAFLDAVGKSMRQIRQAVGSNVVDPKLLTYAENRDILRGQGLDAFRTRPSSLDSWLPWLNSRWEEGARNASALWREMKTKGFAGQSGVVSQWAQRRPLAEKANQSGLAGTPSARVIARLMTTARDDLAKSEAILVAAIEVNVPELAFVPRLKLSVRA